MKKLGLLLLLFVSILFQKNIISAAEANPTISRVQQGYTWLRNHKNGIVTSAQAVSFVTSFFLLKELSTYLGIQTEDSPTPYFELIVGGASGFIIDQCIRMRPYQNEQPHNEELDQRPRRNLYPIRTCKLAVVQRQQ
jgi:hypothetical protein